MKYRDKEIGDMTDQELADNQYDLNWLLGNRENKLMNLPQRLLTKDGKPKFDFNTVNPAFTQIQKEIETEIALRKARAG
jgi:hypothetical protein